MTVRLLPVRVPLVAAETLNSYLARVATANHLDTGDLRKHLGMRTPTRPPDFDRMSTLTGHSPDKLTNLLADACPRTGRTRLSPLRGRPACRYCTRRRGIPTDVECVAPDLRVCRRHLRWLGGITDPVGGQHDLTALPEVASAQRRHHHLIRRHGATPARTAVRAAATITDSWNKHGVITSRQQRCSESLQATTSRDASRSDWPAEQRLRTMLTYPDVVTLAALLADPRWSTIASADRRQDRLQFELEVARRLHLPHIPPPASDPLVTWEEAQALARRWRLHQQPGYRGPEVWLSTCT